MDGYRGSWPAIGAWPATGANIYNPKRVAFQHHSLEHNETICKTQPRKDVTTCVHSVSTSHTANIFPHLVDVGASIVLVLSGPSDVDLME